MQPEENLEITLTISFPAEYVQDVYNGEINENTVSEMFTEYLGEVNLNDLMPTWVVR